MNLVSAVIIRVNSDTENEYLFVNHLLPGGETDIMTSEENSLITSVRDQLGIEITPVSKITQTGDTAYWLTSTIDDCYYPSQGLTIAWLTLPQILTSPNISEAVKDFFSANFV